MAALPAAPGAGQILALARWLAWLALAGALAWHLGHYLVFAAASFGYPFELDYGEGIVWQQAALIPGPRMYGDIAQYPFLVFHYPPAYHLAVRAVAALGVDWVLAGRGVSLAATLSIALLVGAVAWIGSRSPQDAAGRGAAQETSGAASHAAPLAAALVGGLAIVTLDCITMWSPLMRVDMLGIAFAWAGLLLGVLALRRPALLHLAMLAFVAAVYTKQTLVAGPIAVLAVHLLRDPRRALAAGLTGLVAGLLLLGGLSWATGGGFLRHIVLYNINGFSLSLAWFYIRGDAEPILLYLALLALALGWRWWAVWRGLGPAGWRHDPGFGFDAIVTLYLLIAGAMLVTIGKAGANMNYYIEWLTLLCLWLGLLAGMAWWHRLAGIALPLALAAQMAWLAPVRADLGPETGRYREAAALEARARALPGPILTDNMSLLMRLGQEVPYEPAIFVELDTQGVWDPQLMVRLLEQHRFTAVISYIGPHSMTLEQRHPAAVAAAIRAHYPVISADEPFRLFELRWPGPAPGQPVPGQPAPARPALGQPAAD